MSKNCPIMTRMKENYEKRSQTHLTRRIPVIIRLDGKAFHTWTKKANLDIPFDEEFREDMLQIAIYLCENIQGAKMAYTQSDEISILVTDYAKFNTQAWFDYNTQKITSVSASLAASKFNRLRVLRSFSEYPRVGTGGVDMIRDLPPLADFDSRAFNIPKEDVANYFLARQRDAVKNSISSLAQSLYSHKELHKKSSNEMQDMCFDKGYNWNDLPYFFKRGTTVIKNTYVNDELVKVWPNHTHKENDEGKLEFYPAGCRDDIAQNSCRRFNQYPNHWEHIKIEKIRTKWEAIETPLSFDEEFFEKKDLK